LCTYQKTGGEGQYEKEHNDAQRLKDQGSNIGSNTCLVISSEPRIVDEARKRRAQVEEESSKAQQQLKKADW
jgi:hypothetical protein